MSKAEFVLGNLFLPILLDTPVELVFSFSLISTSMQWLNDPVLSKR